LRERLRLSNVEFERLHSMGDRWWRIFPDEREGAAKAILYRIGAENFVDRALIALARSQSKDDDKRWLNLVSLPQRWAPPRFPLAAKDFIERGLAKGRALGAALSRAEEDWIAAGFPMDAAKLKSIAGAAAKAAR
jgi:hypothetical protein